MKIGDKVRVIKGLEEGRIVRFKSNNIVEIEIEDGFTIPVMMGDLVVVAGEEASFFNQKSTGSTTTPAKESTSANPSLVPDELFLGYIPLNERDLTVNIYNYSPYKVLFNISEKNGTIIHSLAHGPLETGKSAFVTYLKIDEFEKWPELFIQVMPVHTSPSELTPVREYIIKPKAKSFFISKSKIPHADKEGYVVGIRNEVKIEAQRLKESLFEQKELSKEIPTVKKTGGDRVIDLHIESLREDHLTIKKEEILDIQKSVFEKELDNAIREGLNSIKFIHGIGNGSLRHIIHKALSQAAHIKYFEDSDKGRFGFGATTVFF